jgi:hypothetical protein
MPVTVCLECGREYYLSGVAIEESRCERCDRPLVEINALMQGPPGGPIQEDGPSGPQGETPPEGPR